MQMIQLETIEVPFRKLVASTENVRTTPAEEEATRQLAASIQAVGLLQSLVVQPAARGKFAVVAGERRYSALTLLLEAGQIPQSYKVPCRLLPKGADTTEVSLAENVERETMDALDECLAFQRLASNGKSIADIAARFGYSEMLIERRLALARLSPALIEHYRKGSANLDLLQAFTLTSDHSLQEQVWNQLPEWNRNPATVRRLLSDKDIPASDPQVRFVTLAAYEAAGGQTKRDLFADEDGNGVFVTDADLLTRLVNEKLQQAAAATQTEGWRWVEIHPDADYSTLAKFRRIPGEPEPLPRKLEGKRKALQKELDTLTGQLDGQEEETEECERAYDRIQQIETDLEEIENSRPVSYPETVKQSCGVIVSLDSNGQARIHPGLLRKEDEAAIRASREDHTDGEASNDQTDGIREPEAGYSAALIQSLTTPFARDINDYFNHVGIGWQLVNGNIVTRSDDVSEAAIKTAVSELSRGGRPTAASHIQSATHALSERPKPNTSGAVSHATNSVECVLNDITGVALTLGKYLDKYPDLFHPALKKSLDGVYGYASDAGARHGREGIEPTVEEAQFAVTTCAAACTLLSATNPKTKA